VHSGRDARHSNRAMRKSAVHFGLFVRQSVCDAAGVTCTGIPSSLVGVLRDCSTSLRVADEFYFWEFLQRILWHPVRCADGTHMPGMPQHGHVVSAHIGHLLDPQESQSTWNVVANAHRSQLEIFFHFPGHPGQRGHSVAKKKDSTGRVQGAVAHRFVPVKWAPDGTSATGGQRMVLGHAHRPVDGQHFSQCERCSWWVDECRLIGSNAAGSRLRSCGGPREQHEAGRLARNRGVSNAGHGDLLALWPSGRGK